MTPPITIDRALTDPKLLGAALGDPETWATWIAVLKATFGVALNREERRAFLAVAGSRRPPKEKVRELWAVVSRRAGKSRMAAAVAAFIACFVKHDLDPGEVGYVLCLAETADQAKRVFDYALEFIRLSPVLRSMIDGEPTRNEIRLTNGVVIAVHVSSFRSVRGKTLLAVVADEISFWRDDTSANPDREIIRAVKPSLVSTGGMLIAISSPYRKVGVLFEKHRDHFDKDGDVLVIQAPSTLLNPTLDETEIAKEREDDPESARGEWDGCFRSDISSLLGEKAINDAVDTQRKDELPPRGTLRFHCFVDASAGRHDAFTVCIGHLDREGHFEADVIRGRKPPFDPQDVVIEYAALAKEYGCGVVVGDHFSGEWIAAAFRNAGLRYEASTLNKSSLYLESVAMFNRGHVRIPKHDELITQLKLLERRVQPSGRDRVDHPQRAGAHDDYANVLAGCIYEAVNGMRRRTRFGSWDLAKITWHDDEEPPRQRIRIVTIPENEAHKHKVY